MNTIFKLATAMAASALATTAADAATFLITYNSTTGGAFSATAPTTDTNVGGFFTITNLVGTRTGLAVTLLAPGSFGGNDNQLSPTPQYLTNDGFSFSAGGLDYNVYLGSATNRYRECSTITAPCGGDDDGFGASADGLQQVG